MKTLVKFLAYLSLQATLAACNDNPVEVTFAEPFPAGGADVAGFAPRDQGQYLEAGDTASTLLVSQWRITRQVITTVKMPTAELDSMGLPRREGPARGLGGELYQVLGLTSDSCRLRWTMADTLARLGPGHLGRLRRYRGWYYLSTPTDSDRWVVERLAVVSRRLYWQKFNPDSLRIGALAQETVRLQRASGQLVFTLSPRRGRATRQVNGYAGLWLVKGDYYRKEH